MALRQFRTAFKPRVVMGELQVEFLKELQLHKFSMSNREKYVIEAVLKAGTYHENHQYHLNKLRKKYGHIMKQIKNNKYAISINDTV